MASLQKIVIPGPSMQASRQSLITEGQTFAAVESPLAGGRRRTSPRPELRFTGRRCH